MSRQTSYNDGPRASWGTVPRLPVLITGLIVGFLAVSGPLKDHLQSLNLPFFSSDNEDLSQLCRQQPKLGPHNTRVENFIKNKIESPEYHAQIISKLSGIIQIPSESYDDLGPIGQDNRWDVFYKIEEYLKSTYATVFKHVRLDNVNTHGLVITWEGSVPAVDAKPLVMMAHQDVVPVLADGVEDWTHPPYSGHYDGEFIWGRGSTDDKGYLISILESVDLLIQSGFKPKRTVIISLGCDEEISSENCGRPISNFLHQKYGDNGIYLVIDEGSVGLERRHDANFALVSLAEKGYIDIGINVTSTGGHASTPPDHNAIGIISEVITKIERSPFRGEVTRKNPMFGFLECAAAHAPAFPEKLRNSLAKAEQGNSKAQAVLTEELHDMRHYFRTSQSVGKINGGLKINAIPEHVTSIVNLRIAVESSVAEVKRHYEDLIRPLAKEHGMIFEGFGSSHSSTEKRKISLFDVDALEPSPVSPVDAEAFQILSGTIRNVLSPSNQGEEIIVSPYLMAANTDTKFSWRLTKNIYRFTPLTMIDNFNHAHTTDEIIKASEFVREPLFFATLILNADDVVN